MNRKPRQPNSRPTNPTRPSPAKSPTARRKSGGTCPARPLDATHHHAPRGIQSDAQPRFAPTRVQPCRVWLAPTTGTDGLRAILRTRTPSAMRSSSLGCGKSPLMVRRSSRANCSAGFDRNPGGAAARQQPLSAHRGSAVFAVPKTVTVRARTSSPSVLEKSGTAGRDCPAVQRNPSAGKTPWPDRQRSPE